MKRTRTSTKKIRSKSYELHPIETKIIFDSPIQESTFIEIDDISEQLNERQRNALFHVQRHGQITRKEYGQINHVSNTTAYEELRDMADKSLLDVKGKGNQVRTKSERLSERLTQGVAPTCQGEKAKALPK